MLISISYGETLDNVEFEQLKKRKHTKLRAFLRCLPKGGLLHVHLSGAIPFEAICKRSNSIYVATSSKSGDTLIYSLISGKYMNYIKTCNKRMFFKVYWKKYKQLSTLSAKQIAELKNEVCLCALGPSAQNTVSGSDYSSQQYALPQGFSNSFIRLKELTHDLEIYMSFFAEFLKKARDENIDYIEIMVNPLREVEPNLKSINYVFGKGKDTAKTLERFIGDQNFDFHAAVLLLKQYIDAVTNFNKELKKDSDRKEGLQQFLPESIDVRFLIGLKRTNITREEDLKIAFKVVNYFINEEKDDDYKNKVLGINLMGDEFGLIGRPADYSSLLPNLQEQYPDVHVSIHASESVIADGHALDSILLGAERIGHGLSLRNNNQAGKLLKEAEICIEACILSNKYLGYFPDVERHPAKQWIKNDKFRVCLNTDDPGILNIDMTDEFYWATRTFDLSLDEIKCLAKESISSSFLPDSEKTQRIKEFDNKFKCFCDKYAVT
jgi:adenosine deaminase